MQVVKYSIKAFYSYDKSDFIELKGVVNISLVSQIGSLTECAKVRVSRKSFVVTPKFIKLTSSHFDEVILQVSEALRVDNNLIELIAKTPLNLPSTINSYGEFAKINANSEFRGELGTDTLLVNFDIAECADIENKLSSMGVKFWAGGGKSFFDSAFVQKGESADEFDTSDFLEFSVNTKRQSAISEIIFNQKNIKDIAIEPTITLVLDPSPQPLSPTAPLTWTNETNGDTYTISPISAIGKVFINTTGNVSSNLALGVEENYTAVEEFELDEDEYVELSGYIKTLNSVEFNGATLNFHAKESEDDEGDFYAHNTLCFAGARSGKLRVSYTTKCYFFSMPPRDIVSNAPIKIGFYNALIDYTHKYELNGYYPPFLEHDLSIIKDYNYDSAFIPRAKISFNGMMYDVNSFGEVRLQFADYGNYEADLYIDNQFVKTLYIAYFANEFTKSFNIKAEE